MAHRRTFEPTVLHHCNNIGPAPGPPLPPLPIPTSLAHSLKQSPSKIVSQSQKERPFTSHEHCECSIHRCSVPNGRVWDLTDRFTRRNFNLLPSRVLLSLVPLHGASFSFADGIDLLSIDVNGPSGYSAVASTAVPASAVMTSPAGTPAAQPQDCVHHPSVRQSERLTWDNVLVWKNKRKFTQTQRTLGILNSSGNRNGLSGADLNPSLPCKGRRTN